MLGPFSKPFSCILSLFVLASCSMNHRSDKESFFLIRRTSHPVELTNRWDSGPWKHADILELTHYMGDKPEHFPKTQVKLLYDTENLYVFFRVEDQYVKAIAEQINDEVFADSCVEFFFAPEPKQQDVYFNLEVNCGGTLLMRYNDPQNGIKQALDLADCRKLEIAPSLPRLILEEIQEPTVWTLSYKLPFDVMAKYSEMKKPQTGVKWKANFYKCADGTSHPHWLTWSFVDNPGPKFHLPQFFGVLEFE